MMRHDLKTRPPLFGEIAEFRCHHDVRKEMDRTFRVGDALVLREWDGGAYTGRAIEVEVSCVSRGPELALPEGMVVLSIEPRSELLEGVFPPEQSDPAVTKELLSIASVDVPLERVEAWSSDERRIADEWASAVVLDDGIDRQPMPPHVARDQS